MCEVAISSPGPSLVQAQAQAQTRASQTQTRCRQQKPVRTSARAQIVFLSLPRCSCSSGGGGTWDVSSVGHVRVHLRSEESAKQRTRVRSEQAYPRTRTRGCDPELPARALRTRITGREARTGCSCSDGGEGDVTRQYQVVYVATRWLAGWLAGWLAPDPERAVR